MTDKISKSRRSRNMAAIKSKDMKPEMIVRRLVHGMGYRYRLHRKDLPGKPDLVFGPQKKILFVNGCFWHQHPEPDCIDARIPKSNIEYWKKKLKRNAERDRLNKIKLEDMGWNVLVVWECEIGNGEVIKKRIRVFLDGSD